MTLRAEIQVWGIETEKQVSGLLKREPALRGSTHWRHNKTRRRRGGWSQNLSHVPQQSGIDTHTGERSVMVERYEQKRWTT
jgi:hypothetical protein